MSDRELIEDYCLRAARVHPWAGEAGSLIKSLKSEVERLRVYALRWEAVQEMLTGTTVQDGDERLWTVRTPVVDRVGQNHMAEFRECVDAYMSQFTVPQTSSEEKS